MRRRAVAGHRQRALLSARRAGDSPRAAGSPGAAPAPTSSSCTGRSTPTRRTPRSSRRRPARHPRDQHRRDVAHRAGRDGRRRHRPAEAAALRRRARLRPSRRSSASRRTRPISARAGRAGWDRASPCGSGTSATACVRIASPTSRGSIWPRRCSTCWPGAATRQRSSGSRRHRARCSRPRWRCSRRLGALDDGRLTATRRTSSRPAAAPTPGRGPGGGRGIARGGRRVRAAGRRRRGRCGIGATTTSDVLPALDAWSAAAGPYSQAAEQLHATGGGVARRIDAPHIDETSGCAARCWPAIPDRVARRREPARRVCCWPRAPAPNWPATAASRVPSGWSRSTWPARQPEAMPGCSPPAAVDREWLEPTATIVEHTWSAIGPRARNARDVVRRAAPEPKRQRRATRQPPPIAARRRLSARPHDDADDAAAPPAPLHRRRRRRAGARRHAAAVAQIRRRHRPRLAHSAVGRSDQRLEQRRARDVSPCRADARPHSTIATTAASRRRSSCRSCSGWPRRRASDRAQEPVLLLLLAPNGRPVQTTRDLQELLGADVSGGAEGTARALPAASVARRSVDGHADRAYEARK